MANEGKIQVLADWLEKQVGDPSITDGSIMEEMGVANGTFYRWKPKATEELIRRLNLAKEAKDRVNVLGAEQQAKIGLKTKQERLLILQKEVDACLCDLNPKDEKQQLDVYEKVALRKTIVSLQSEISKIEGDYAPDKVHDVTPPTPLAGLTFQQIYVLKYGREYSTAN